MPKRLKNAKIIRMAKIAVFRHDPYCSRSCAAAVAAVLARDHEVKEIELSDLTRAGLSAFDMLVMPGGEGDVDRFPSLFTLRREIVQNFVEGGGAYLGICMGAYWGGRRYFGLLPQTDCIQYITRPRAEVRRSFKTTLRVDWEGASEAMFFYDGCTFIGDDDSFDVVSRYSNGDPMAIIRDRIGLIGCHPESARDWYDTPALASEWHQGRHHDLLRHFVTRLLRPARDIDISLLERLEVASVPDDHLLRDAAEEIRTLRSALQTIQSATDFFAHGTLRQVNHLARSALQARPQADSVSLLDKNRAAKGQGVLNSE